MNIDNEMTGAWVCHELCELMLSEGVSNAGVL